MIDKELVEFKEILRMLINRQDNVESQILCLQESCEKINKKIDDVVNSVVATDALSKKSTEMLQCCSTAFNQTKTVCSKLVEKLEEVQEQICECAGTIRDSTWLD